MYPWHKEPRGMFEAYLGEDRVPHALLLHGPSGLGKLDLARSIARELLCLEQASGGCGECRSCTVFAGGAHPDFRYITFEINSKTGKLRDVIIVPQIRALIETLYKTTTIGDRKVAIVYPAERMNHSAANALLKTLEEPAGNTVLILVAHDAGRLPATVRSRCQRLMLRLPSRPEAIEWLSQVSDASENDADDALTAAAGSPLDALAMLDGDALENYRGTVKLLAMLRRGVTSDGKALAAMSDFDDESVWTWLSLCCARLLRNALERGASGAQLQALADLQRQADRNRMLTATTVRQDFLLRDWLIQWKDLPVTLPLDQNTQEA